MPSDKRNSIMAKAMGLIFSLFDVTHAFWHTAVHTMHSSQTYLLCVPFIFADSERC